MSAGRPKNRFGMPPGEYEAWKQKQEWRSEPWQLLDEGGALGMDVENPTFRVSFTSSVIDRNLFWVEADNADGLSFHAPMPISRDSIPKLMQAWGMERCSWTESLQIARLRFKGPVPREFILQPGPYWYLTTEPWELHDGSPWKNKTWTLHYDKRAPTTNSPLLALLIGPHVYHLGDVSASRIPPIGHSLFMPKDEEVLKSMFHGSALFFDELFLDGQKSVRPFTSNGVRNVL
jgi:hypothetical protein